MHFSKGPPTAFSPVIIETVGLLTISILSSPLFSPSSCIGFTSVLQTLQVLYSFSAFAKTVLTAGPLHNAPFNTSAYTIYSSLFEAVSFSFIPS